MDRYGRTTYTPAQITAFFDRIALPAHHRTHPLLTKPALARSASALPFLAVLQKYTLATIPFESLSLHYSVHRSISIDAQALFEKIVTQGRGRGGYCMENSCLFGTVLRSLGFDVYPTGARVNEAVQPMSGKKNWAGPKFDGWNHMINIVTIEGKKYFADVGFGSSGPHHPIPLIENYTAENVGTQSLRLVRDAPPDLLTTSAGATTTADQHLWVYQYRHSDTSPWLPAYCFGETEFTPSDFTMMNYFTSTHPTSWFTFVVLCVKMVMEGEELVGDVTLVGADIKKRVGGSSETLADLKTEEDRVEALEKFMGVTLAPEEKTAIRGRFSEL